MRNVVRTMKIPVFRKGHEEEGFHWIDLTSEVTHFSHTRKGIEIHTKDHVYTPITTLEEWRMFLNPLGYEKLDVGNAVNMNLVEVFDEESQKVFFEKNPDPTESKFADVARVHIAKVVHLKKDD